MAKDIGILAADIYFPQRFVSQEALEQHDGVAVGKYTLGLGQQSMAFCDETEDINSICMNAVEGLLRRFGVSPREVGRLEVGTETTVDKSKSVKSTLMPIFAEHGNTDVEGIDTTNACYGGTNALFNSLAWMESSAWDGRYAVVVAADIAVYEKGPARPTGGAGAVALLIGPNAPIVFDRRLRGSHFEHAWDFYKPHMASEYPCVDGHLSNTCYLRALDSCYARYADKFAARGGAPLDVSADFQHALFHQPYFKLVQKSFARLMFAQARKYPELASTAALAPFAGMDAEVSYSDKELAKTASQVAAPLIERVVEPGTTVGRRLGNLYCGSLYAAVLSLITYGSPEPGDRVLLFSYGSGLAATMFSATVAAPVDTMRDTLDLARRLDARSEASPAEFEDALSKREQWYTKTDYEIPAARYVPPGSYFLRSVDSLGRRQYARALHTSARAGEARQARVLQAAARAVRGVVRR